MAVTCGTPTPATTLVVQIEPGPTPTFTASAPASTSASVASAVATLPTTSSAPSKRAFNSRAIVSTPTEWPCAVSSTSTSAPASTSAAARSSASGPTPTAAATRSRPWSSFVACGYAMRFEMSLTVMRPRNTPSASTTGSFSILWRWRMPSASSSVVPSGAVTRPSLVISSDTGRSGSRWNRRSRFVRMPTRRPRSSVTGMPEMR